MELKNITLDTKLLEKILQYKEERVQWATADLVRRLNAQARRIFVLEELFSLLTPDPNHYQYTISGFAIQQSFALSKLFKERGRSMDPTTAKTELDRIFQIVQASIRWNGIDIEDLAVDIWLESCTLKEPMTRHIIRCRCTDAVRSLARTRRAETAYVKSKVEDYIPTEIEKSDLLNRIMSVAGLSNAESLAVYKEFYAKSGTKKPDQALQQALQKLRNVTAEILRENEKHEAKRSLHTEGPSESNIPS